MKKAITLAFFLVTFFPLSTSLAEAPVIALKPSTNDLIALYADKYNVSQETLNKVIKCESKYNAKAIGDGGHSFGLVQIHLPSHPNITKAQAFDKDFAIEYLAKNLSEGKGKMWTCFNLTVKAHT